MRRGRRPTLEELQRREVAGRKEMIVQERDDFTRPDGSMDLDKFMEELPDPVTLSRAELRKLLQVFTLEGNVNNIIVVHQEVHYDWKDRLRLLFRGFTTNTFHIRAQFMPGKTEVVLATLYVPPIIKKKLGHVSVEMLPADAEGE